MRLYLLPPSFNGQENLILKKKDFNYITKVLRFGQGRKLLGRDHDGGLWNLEIEEVAKDYCRLKCIKTTEEKPVTDALPESRPLKPIILYQCLPKGRKADDIIKKATEVGVRDIVLVKSRNCVASLEGKEETRLARYEAMVKEAVQQSGSLVATKVCSVIDISEVPSDFENRCNGDKGLGLFLHQCSVSEQQSSLTECLSKFSGVTSVLVGPEGGLTEQECQDLLKAGFHAILLKTNILRCETASIYALGAIQTILENPCQ